MSGPLEELLARVEVRDARPEEFAAIGALRVAAYRADGFLSDTSTYAATLRTLGADGTGEILAAVEDEAIVGTVTLQLWPQGGQVVRAPGEAEIRALAVAKDARGRGIGRALLTAVTERAAAREMRQLVLLTLPDMRAARRLYVAAGFSRLPERDYWPGSGPTLLAFGLNLGGG